MDIGYGPFLMNCVISQSGWFDWKAVFSSFDDSIHCWASWKRFPILFKKSWKWISKVMNDKPWVNSKRIFYHRGNFFGNKYLMWLPCIFRWKYSGLPKKHIWMMRIYQNMSNIAAKINNSVKILSKIFTILWPKLNVRMSKRARGMVKTQRRMSQTARFAMKMFLVVIMSWKFICWIIEVVFLLSK